MTPAQSAREIGDRHVLTPGAFDLIRVDGGAALVWASRGSRALSLTTFDESGTEHDTTEVLADTSPLAATTTIVELAGAARGNDLALAWLEESGSSARARSLVRPIQNASSGSIVELGAVLEPVSKPRGNLALVSSRDHFVVLARGQKSPCIDATETDCVEFGFRRLEAKQALPQGLPLTVPLPCPENSVSFAVANSRTYYGVCSHSTGKPVTTLFSIQTDPEYARADRVLEGCSPLGAQTEGEQLWVVGECAGQRRGVRVRGGNSEISDLRVDRLDAVCQAGHPVIHQTGSDGLSLTLDAPRERLEAFLPPALAAPTARAVWTGETLLVAQVNDSLLTLKGYRCDSTLLREVPLLRARAANHD